MRKTSFAALLAVAAAMSGPALAAGEERLVSPPLPDFVVGNEGSQGRQSIREEVPRGETVEAWTRMVTTQRFLESAPAITPVVYARSVLAGLPAACPGASVSPVTGLTVSGHPAARFQVDCPHSVGGRPETFILLAVASGTTMHVKQVAFRGRITPADLGWARGFLGSTVLCAPGSRLKACQ